MLRRAVLGLTIATLVAVPAIVSPRAEAISPLVVRQDGGGDFTLIQDAIDAAAPGDVIEIADDGIYLENLVIYRNQAGQTLHGLTLRAAAGADPVIDGGWDGVQPGGPCSGPAEDGSVVKVYQADDVTIEGLEIVNARGGVDQAAITVMQTVDRLTIRGNVLHRGRNDGIQFADACGVGPYRGVVIEHNHIYDFVDDEFPDGAACIKVHDAIDAVIRRNDVHDCERGIVAYEGDATAMTGGEISFNRIHGIHHFLADGSPGAEDEGIKLDDRSADVRIHRNEIWANGDNGIRLDNVIDIDVTHNTVWGNGAPGPVAGPVGGPFVGPLGDELNRAGILVHNGSHTRIRVIDNIVTRSTGSGIVVANADLADGTSTFDYNNVFDNAGPQYRDLDVDQSDRGRIEGSHDRPRPSSFKAAPPAPEADFELVCGSAAVDAGVDAGNGEPYSSFAPDAGARESAACAGGPDCRPSGVLFVSPGDMPAFVQCVATRDFV